MPRAMNSVSQPHLLTIFQCLSTKVIQARAMCVLYCAVLCREGLLTVIEQEHIHGAVRVGLICVYQAAKHVFACSNFIRDSAPVALSDVSVGT